MKKGSAICVLAAVLLITHAAGQITMGAAGGNASHYQGVGGDFGRAWLQNFLIQNPPPANTSENNSLWNWGGAPVDKMLVNGKLVPKNNRTVNIIAQDWMGETPLGKPVYLNSSYNLGAAAPLSPSYLSDDPWIRAQQLETVVVTPQGY